MIMQYLNVDLYTKSFVNTGLLHYSDGYDLNSRLITNQPIHVKYLFSKFRISKEVIWKLLSDFEYL